MGNCHVPCAYSNENDLRGRLRQRKKKTYSQKMSDGLQSAQTKTSSFYEPLPFGRN